ncbi:MAG: hypothetical protein ACI9C1_002547 [Candidatus Aldehydirespiratoraceae bacterium]
MPVKAAESSSAQLHQNESSTYSQNGEDGILAALFNAIGVTNRVYVEFGAGTGDECNTRLLGEQGWTGLRMDGVDQADGSDIRQEFITAENVNELFAKYGVPDEFDLLSIDIDSNDYWVLRSLDERYRPRVLVMEYNASLGPTERKTIAYDPAYVWDVSSYFGASLAALHSVAEQRGYSLVGCDSLGVNCFFVRTDCLAGFAALTPEQAYVPPGYGLFIWGRHIGFSPSARAFVHV